MAKGDSEASGGAPSHARSVIARAFTWVEDLVYVGLGALLAISAVILLGSTVMSFTRDLIHATLPRSGAMRRSVCR